MLCYSIKLKCWWIKENSHVKTLHTKMILLLPPGLRGMYNFSIRWAGIDTNTQYSFLHAGDKPHWQQLSRKTNFPPFQYCSSNKFIVAFPLSKEYCHILKPACNPEDLNTLTSHYNCSVSLKSGNCYTSQIRKRIF